MKARKTKPTRPTPSASDGMLPPATPESQPIVPWLKLDPATRSELIVCSNTWLGAQTHWADGRMKIHTSPPCRWCQKGSPIRFFFFLHLVNPTYQRQYVVQLSAGNMGPLVKARDQFGDLRGCKVELARRGKRPNSPTTISFLSEPMPSPNLPPAFDIRAKLTHATDWDHTPVIDRDKPEDRKT